jgi:hypothetical protein
MGGKGSGRPRSACGTPAAYRGHSKRKENPCQACKDAWAAYKKRYYKTKLAKPRVRAEKLKAEIHKQIVRDWKMAAKTCMDCGFEINDRTFVCIDCDHRDPSQKTFTISYMIGKVTVEQLLDELAKCDPVCRNCHALRTHDNQHHLARRKPTPTQPGLFDVKPQT